MTNPLTKIQCWHCDKMFQPTNKFNKYCDKCAKKIVPMKAGFAGKAYKKMRAE